VTRIEQTLRAMKAKAEGKDVPRVPGRTTPAPEDVTAEITESGSHDIRIDAPPPAPSSRRLLGGKATGGHVAFSSDTPKAGMRHLATSPSLRRVHGRRRFASIAGGVATLIAIAAVAVIKATPSHEDASSATPRGVPSAMALPTGPAAALNDVGNAGASSPQPVASTISVDKLPSVKMKPASLPASTSLRKSSSPPAKKHLSVLDSPD
jgi:hypothetical protein